MVRAVVIYLGLLLMGLTPANAQFGKIADDLFGTSQEKVVDSINTAKDRLVDDSLKLAQLNEELQQMKLNEILYLKELEQSREYMSSDSLKKVEHHNRIDSLRAITMGAPIIIEKDTVFTVYSARGGISFAERALETQKIIYELAKNRLSASDSLYLLKLEAVTEIMMNQTVIYSVTRDDAIWMGKEIHSLASEYKESIQVAVNKLQVKNSLFNKLKRLGLFALIIILQLAVIRVINYYYRKLRARISRRKGRLKPIMLREYEFLNVKRQIQWIILATSLLRYLVILLTLIVSVPLLFSIFPATRGFANQLFGYVLDPIKSILGSIIAYIPNVFIIVIIWLCVRYLLRGLQFVSDEIETEKLKITGFYPDWARPTYTIIRFLLYAFMIAMIYPHLPGSESPVFKGISIFVGLIVSFGSSGVVGNIISGMIITYMRPFRIGDRIQLENTVGNVIEKTPLVTRIKTPKNEIITIPNSFIMSTQTINYTMSAENYGLIIHTTVNIGFETPWQKVHQLLIHAAKITEGVMPDKEPFVQELQFDDTSPVYQINAYIKDANLYSKILSDLLSNVQSVMAEAGVAMETFQLYTHRGDVPGRGKVPTTAATIDGETKNYASGDSVPPNENL